MTKICTKCKKEKDLDLFKINKKMKNGRGSWCKKCHSECSTAINKANRPLANKNGRLYKERHPEKVRARRKYDKALRRSRIKNATLGETYNKEIYEIYKNCPTGYEVDHILPLTNNRISGLHVPWNLQYLPREMNQSKGNFFDGYYDNTKRTQKV